MEQIANIVSVPNVWASSLRVIASKGYSLSATCSAPESATIAERYAHLSWIAEKNNIKLFAPNPTELLGLVALAEFKEHRSFEPYWWVVEGEDLQEQILAPLGLSSRPKSST